MVFEAHLPFGADNLDVDANICQLVALFLTDSLMYLHTNILHHTSLLYSFACMLIGFTALNELSAAVFLCIDSLYVHRSWASAWYEQSNQGANIGKRMLPACIAHGEWNWWLCDPAVWFHCFCVLTKMKIALDIIHNAKAELKHDARGTSNQLTNFQEGSTAWSSNDERRTY